MSLRNDGEFEIYQIQARRDPDPKDYGWFIPEVAQIPKKYRWTNDKPHPKHKEPFNSFSASGKCWQETGIFGTYDFRVALDLLQLCMDHIPNFKFRVIKLIISQETKVVVSEA